MTVALHPNDDRELRSIDQRIAQALLDADAAYVEGDTREAGRLVETAFALHRARRRLLRAIGFAALVELGVDMGRVVDVPGEH